MMTEFSAIAMNDSAVEKCRVIRQSFSDALSAIKQHIKPGRELALATTKMQEACMWAIENPENTGPKRPWNVVEEVSR